VPKKNPLKKKKKNIVREAGLSLVIAKCIYSILGKYKKIELAHLNIHALL